MWTIRNRFLVFGLICMLPLLGFGWLLINDHNSARKDDLIAAQTTTSSQVTNALVGYLGNNFRSLEGLAGSPLIQEGEDAEVISSVLGQSRTVKPDYIGMFVLNDEGELTSQAGNVDDSVLPAIESQVDGVLATGQRSLSGRIDLPLDPPTSVFVILVPITTAPATTSGTEEATSTPAAGPAVDSDADDGDPTTSPESPGTVRGVIGAIIHADTLAPYAIPPARGRTEIVVIADEKIVLASGDIRANESEYLSNFTAQNAVISEEGTNVFRMNSVTGTERTAVWTPLPLDSTNWTVLVTDPLPQGQLQDMWPQLLALGAIAASVYIVIAYTFGELSSRSLNDLTESANRLADGDFKTPIAKRGSGEFADLRASLVELRESIEAVMLGSESQQEERQRQNEQLRDLLRRDSRVQEDERRHIASEIHDAVSPLITGALYQSRALQRQNGDTTPEMVQSSLTDVNDLLERASAELHGIIFDLRPPDLDDLGVVAAIEAFVNTIQRTGMEARLEVIDEPPPLTPEVRLAIYRIVQEALHNVLRHSGADEAVVRLEYVNQLLRVTIHDNGAGFDPASARRPTSLGLLSMSERAAAIDADFEILSRPGGGTVIIVERRDTGSIMSDELLDNILRGRAETAELNDADRDSDTPDEEDVHTDAEASR